MHIVLRSGGSHDVTEALTRCGTRISKEYFLAVPLTDPKAQHVLWWSPFGPDRTMNLRDTHATLTALVQCQVSGLLTYMTLNICDLIGNTLWYLMLYI